MNPTNNEGYGLPVKSDVPSSASTLACMNWTWNVGYGLPVTGNNGFARDPQARYDNMMCVSTVPALHSQLSPRTAGPEYADTSMTI